MLYADIVCSIAVCRTLNIRVGIMRTVQSVRSASISPLVWNVPDGFKVQAILKDPICGNWDGTTFLYRSLVLWTDMHEMFVMSDSSKCGHIGTMCPECAWSWENDYLFRVVPKGYSA